MRYFSLLFVGCLLFVMGCFAQDTLLPGGLAEDYMPRHSFRTTSFTGWTYGGDTVIMDDFIRLTPTEKSRKGWLWNTFPNSFADWLVLTEVRVSPNPDSPSRLGADGMAIWFTKERAQPGPIFGNKDQWTGLGVILDTFDNDNKRDNPRIQIVYNDGTKFYDKNQDGRNVELAGCQVNYRGQSPIRLKIAYYGKRIQISYDATGQVEDHRQWTACNIDPLYLDLPRLGYFGITAETGELFDNHDVYNFVTYRLGINVDATNINRATVFGEDQDRETAERQKAENERLAKDRQRQQEEQAQAELLQQTKLRQQQEEQERARSTQQQQTTQQQTTQQTGGSALEHKIDALINAMASSGNRGTQYGGDLGNLATKADVLQLATKADVANCRAGSSDGVIAQMKNDLLNVQNKVVSNHQDLTREVQELKVSLRTLLASLDQVKNGVEGAKNEVRNVGATFERSRATDAQSASSSGSWSWLYLLIVEVFVFAGYTFWKKRKEDSKKIL